MTILMFDDGAMAPTHGVRLIRLRSNVVDIKAGNIRLFKKHNAS